MRELAIVVGILLVLFLLSFAWMLPWESVMDLGAVLLSVGSVIGVPTGVWYHVLLYRALAPRGDLERGWIWNPFRFHDRLLEEERGPVTFFAYAGGLGFVVLALGIVLIVGSMALFYLRTR